MSKEQFWAWFEENMSALEEFISTEPRDYEIYESLSYKLKEFNEFLIPEITVDKQNRCILIISCDGIKKGIPYVEKLTEDLKEYPNWRIVKYRQPGPMKFIPLNGVMIKRKNIFLKWDRTSDNKYHLTFYVKGYIFNNRNYEIGTLLHMDHTIGEFDAMTKIENVKIQRLGFFQSKTGLKTLDDLKIKIDSNS